ncbi:hypothetical protein GQ43DRAFT_444860 [Delitschia confertaspora ATCC 74209]|uniref:Uncharacterized protein n=1 Tax=Delitschia confertaspora ATCC 74209 TaxID=1513339 RepID=A0A9P4JCN3_9PLEO|nr:hypothetical protein GQ43DRAFT_444860 [Delitschia confertaspora ATCC 74209]
MVLARSSALRASSIARLARPARSCRIAELQPWQRALQQNARRTYASEHGAHGAATKTSDLPWAVAAVLATGVGLYTVTTQDTSHGTHHDEHLDELHAREQKGEVVQPEAIGEEKQESEPKEEESAEEPAADESKEGIQPSAHKTDDKAPSNPADSDLPDARKEPKSQNEISGKQEGLDNDDTKHTANIENDPEKSKKGEGVAESAKLKGTVAADRPDATNKEERGKARQDYSK